METSNSGVQMIESPNIAKIMSSDSSKMIDSPCLSQKSMLSLSNSNYHHYKHKLEKYTWVQCDNMHCQKWRKIATKDSEGLEEISWYCHMNPDKNFNSCCQPEEDYGSYDRLARKLGFKYVMSNIQEGTLVWAKTTGYCRWPAVVCRDVDYNIYYEVDCDGFPWKYHVEYLGKQHSRAWIVSTFVSLYGYREDAPSEKLDEPKHAKKKKRKRRRLRTLQKSKKTLKKYRHSAVDEAIEEADKLLALSVEERLKSCKFAVKTQKEKKSPLCKTDLKQNIPFKGQKFSELPTVSSKCKRLKSGEENSGSKVTHRNKASQQVIACKNVKMEAEECLSPGSGKFDCSKLNIKNTMLDKTKEEKYRIDVQMYKKNERAFDHDLHRFMSRNGVKIRSFPIWSNTPIGLFELFMAVYERGGYEKVCQNSKWASVYRELTNMGHSSGGATARSFYERNLYPYELYVTGGDFTDVIEKIKSRKRKQRKKDVNKESKSNFINVKEEEDDESMLPSEKSELDDILDELNSNQTNIFQLHDEIEEAQKRLGIDVTYHEDSTPQDLSEGLMEAYTASEFGAASLPKKGAQLVPSLMFSSSDSSQSHDILHELQALENQFEEFDKHVMSQEY